MASSATVRPLGAAGLGDLAGGVVDLVDEQDRPRHGELFLVRAGVEHRERRAHGGERAARGVGGLDRCALPRGARARLEEPLLRELLLEVPEHGATVGRIHEGLSLALDAEEARHEAGEVGRAGEQRLGHLFRLHSLAVLLAVSGEAGVPGRVGGAEVGVEPRRELGQACRHEEIGVGEPCLVELELGRIGGGRHPAGEVGLDALLGEASRTALGAGVRGVRGVIGRRRLHARVL